MAKKEQIDLDEIEKNTQEILDAVLERQWGITRMNRPMSLMMLHRVLTLVKEVRELRDNVERYLNQIEFFCSHRYRASEKLVDLGYKLKDGKWIK